MLCLPLPQHTVLVPSWQGYVLHRQLPAHSLLSNAAVLSKCWLVRLHVAITSLYSFAVYQRTLSDPYSAALRLFDLRRSNSSSHVSPLLSLMRYNLHYPILSVQWVLVSLQLCKHYHSPVWEYFYHRKKIPRSQLNPLPVPIPTPVNHLSTWFL